MGCYTVIFRSGQEKINCLFHGSGRVYTFVYISIFREKINWMGVALLVPEELHVGITTAYI